MNISHNPDQQEFVMGLGSTKAVLQYRLLPASAGGKARVDFTRTYVPPEFRGQGHAEALVKHGLSWASQQGLKVQACCWYVRDFL